MSRGTSGFGSVVVTMCVTVMGLVGGYHAVTQYLGSQVISAGQKDDSTAAPKPQRKSTLARNDTASRGDPPNNSSSTESAPCEGPVEQADPSETNADDEAVTGSPSATEPAGSTDASGSRGNPRTIVEEAERRAEARFYR